MLSLFLNKYRYLLSSLEKTGDWFFILGRIIWTGEVGDLLSHSSAAVPVLEDTAGPQSHRRAVAGDGPARGEALQLVVAEAGHLRVRLTRGVAKQAQLEIILIIHLFLSDWTVGDSPDYSGHDLTGQSLDIVLG